MARVTERTPNSGWRTVETRHGELIRANGLAAVKRIKRMDTLELHIEWLKRDAGISKPVLDVINEYKPVTPDEVIVNEAQEAEEEYLTELTGQLEVTSDDDYEEEEEEDDDDYYYYDEHEYDDDDMLLGNYSDDDESYSDVTDKYAEGFARLNEVTNRATKKEECFDTLPGETAFERVERLDLF